MILIVYKVEQLENTKIIEILMILKIEKDPEIIHIMVKIPLTITK